MISAIAYFFGLVLGVVLTIQLAAALYSIHDHWYRITRFRRRVVTSILVWGAVWSLAYMVLPGMVAAGMVSGARFWLGCHLVVALLAIFIKHHDRRQREKEYQAFLNTL